MQKENTRQILHFQVLGPVVFFYTKSCGSPQLSRKTYQATGIAGPLHSCCQHVSEGTYRTASPVASEEPIMLRPHFSRHEEEDQRGDVSGGSI